SSQRRVGGWAASAPKSGGRNDGSKAPLRIGRRTRSLRRRTAGRGSIMESATRAESVFQGPAVGADEDRATLAQQSETACLLDTGALYDTRVLLRPANGDPIFAGFKAGAFSLYFGDEPIYHFDLEGRWQRAFVKGIHYLKGLDGAVQSIDRVREGAN